ncbi:RNA polymerase I-specific transcription initiation factor rrn7 like protein [Verticillium longisporum]|uniref:RNA polymerase I-specific transcription initiation factor rrn7 like protein n=1 Tax=Verticillium longisporum TaxID=100787 RepID=A0A8I2ZZN7_VERLO|nr:RNA polymerase I-specific transcription initiation factor rrn7 like protein [Verticillium longisporum]
MDAEDTREFHKFPKGERCVECGSKKWYWDGGRRYCRRGHQVEGVVQFEFGDDEYGDTGKVARKAKEVRQREKQKLAGKAARDLYLECVQLVLRLQVDWLVNAKGHKAELETVVRDLWDLRLRGSPAAATEEQMLHDSTSEAELSVFSSQPTSEQDESGSTLPHRKKRAKSWASDAGDGWPAPRLPDTLALCYLGCLLLRAPTRIGDFVRWAKGGNITYKQASRQMPQEMWNRLPATHQKQFQVADLARFDDGELHSSVMNLALSFHANYEMVFPPLNDVLMTLQYWCFPFEQVSLPSQDDNGQIPKLDWDKWHAVMSQAVKEARATSSTDYRTATAADITSMPPDELDKYFTHVALHIESKDENAFLAEFFPVEEARPKAAEPEEADDALNKRLQKVQIEAASFDEEKESQPTGTNLRYFSYRTLGDLPPHGRAFYDRAAQLAGLSTESLLKAVNMLELQIRAWRRRQKKQATNRSSMAATEAADAASSDDDPIDTINEGR